LLVLAGVDALRSAGSKGSAPTMPASTVTRTAIDSARIRQFVLAADAICGQANAELMRRGTGGGNMEWMAWWNKVAARTAEKSLRELRVLPAPAADQALLEDFLLRAKVVIYGLRQVSAAASAGNRRRMSVLVGGEVDAIHRKDARADRLSARWRLDDPEILRRCPVSLPALSSRS